ncbi:MAG: hypothetical protein HS108_08555 [Planctomycetes bacterium]|jgi:hypothetical protein|nr:hypothetical protein [Planctomycetota bacterium]MCL4731866.1 hypothetical protein [Planctomycetota bacterium]
MSVAISTRTPSGTTPSAAALLFAACLGFGAAWGAQLLLAVELIEGLEVQPAGYWFVYGLIGAAGTVALYWLARLFRVRVAQALMRRPVSRFETRELVREYLLLRDARTRGREISGTGGPCPSPRWVAYLNRPKV